MEISMKEKYKIGFTQGTFDMFHIGHLNLLRNAKEQCEKLIVGVNSDELVQKYKNKTPVISAYERAEIIRELRCVDEVVICETLDKKKTWDDIHFNAIFIGNDWFGNPRWKQTEIDLEKVNARVVYLQHTDGVSSSLLRKQENFKVED